MAYEKRKEERREERRGERKRERKEERRVKAGREQISCLRGWFDSPMYSAKRNSMPLPPSGAGMPKWGLTVAATSSGFSALQLVPGSGMHARAGNKHALHWNSKSRLLHVVFVDTPNLEQHGRGCAEGRWMPSCRVLELSPGIMLSSLGSSSLRNMQPNNARDSSNPPTTRPSALS